MNDLNFSDYEMYLIKDAVIFYFGLHPDVVEYRSIIDSLTDYCDKL